MKKVRKDTPEMKIDPRVEKEPTCPLPTAAGSPKHQISITLELIEIIEKMRNEMVGPDGQMEETKFPIAMQMSRYPSMESVEFDSL